MTALRLDTVDAGHAGGTHLHHINLNLAPGRVHAVVGHNGAGKTTLLHTIAGLIRPTSGRILLNDTDITRHPTHVRARAGIGYVPQDARTFASLTVGEHLTLARRHRPTPLGSATERVLALLPQLAHRRHRGRELSGGEQHILAIARTLQTNPRLLLLDEPTEGLAPALAGHIRAVITTLAADGLTILLATPQPDLAATTATGIVHILTAGRIRTTITADTLTANPNQLRTALALPATDPTHPSTVDICTAGLVQARARTADTPPPTGDDR